MCNHLMILFRCTEARFASTFSIGHIEKANEAMAVETLLVTDELFRLEKNQSYV